MPSNAPINPPVNSLRRPRAQSCSPSGLLDAIGIPDQPRDNSEKDRLRIACPFMANLPGSEIERGRVTAKRSASYCWMAANPLAAPANLSWCAGHDLHRNPFATFQ